MTVRVPLHLVVLSLLLLVQPGSALSDKAARFQACYSLLLQAVPLDDNSTSAISGNTPGVLSDELAEAMASGLPDALVDDLCASIKAPGVLDQLKRGAQAAAAGMASAAAASTASRDGATVRAAAAVDGSNLDAPYERILAKDNLYKPHDAEYQDFSYTASIYQLYGQGMHSGDFRSRAWPSGRAMNLEICKVVVLVLPIVGKTCDIIDAAIPACLPVPKGLCDNPPKVIGKACKVAYYALALVEFFCEDNYNQFHVIDRSINGMQILATHENTKKTLDNQQIIWNKADKEYSAFSQLLKNRFMSMLQRQCKLENDVAAAQREVNYLRKLLLTPDNLKPGFACWSSRTCAVNFDKTSCTSPCSMTLPSGCTSGSLQTSLVAPASSPSTTISCSIANAR